MLRIVIQTEPRVGRSYEHFAHWFCGWRHRWDGGKAKEAAQLKVRVNSGDTTPCRMTGVALHSHVHYKEI